MSTRSDRLRASGCRTRLPKAIYFVRSTLSCRPTFGSCRRARPVWIRRAFSARAKTYRTGSAHSSVLSPFQRRYAWHISRALDLDAMRAAAGAGGEHDFTSFQAKGGSSGQAFAHSAVGMVRGTSGGGGRLLIYEIAGPVSSSTWCGTSSARSFRSAMAGATSVDAANPDLENRGTAGPPPTVGPVISFALITKRPLGILLG